MKFFSVIIANMFVIFSKTDCLAIRETSQLYNVAYDIFKMSIEHILRTDFPKA